MKRQLRKGVNLAKSIHSVSGGAKKCAEINNITSISGLCSECGAWRGQLGLEPTPKLFVEHLTLVFEEVRRVLKKTGTLWLNLGDTYSTVPHGHGTWTDPAYAGNNHDHSPPNRKKIVGLKHKDLVGVPWMVAFALRDAGWHLRQDIIWSKLNPMPESVRDRCTKSHEYIFLLSKGPKYYYDAEAIKEPVTGGSHPRGKVNGEKPFGWANSEKYHGANPRERKRGVGPKAATPSFKTKQNASFSAAVADLVDIRNKRSVWTAPPEHLYDLFIRWYEKYFANRRSVWPFGSTPFAEAHFATFPPALVRPCILAGSAPGDMILDPFGGSGTTGMVAIQEARNATLIELSAEYLGFAKKRCDKTPGFPDLFK